MTRAPYIKGSSTLCSSRGPWRVRGFRGSGRVLGRLGTPSSDFWGSKALERALGRSCQASCPLVLAVLGPSKAPKRAL